MKIKTETMKLKALACGIIKGKKKDIRTKYVSIFINAIDELLKVSVVKSKYTAYNSLIWILVFYDSN